MKTFGFIVKVFVAAMVAMLLAAWAEEHHVGYRWGFVTVYLFGAVVVYYAIECIVGIVRRYRRRQQERDAIASFRRSIDYRQAAVFVGTACLYLGTPADCDELCDDLWHRGVQAKVRQLSGEETSFDIL